MAEADHAGAASSNAVELQRVMEEVAGLRRKLHRTREELLQVEDEVAGLRRPAAPSGPLEALLRSADLAEPLEVGPLGWTALHYAAAAPVTAAEAPRLPPQGGAVSPPSLRGGCEVSSGEAAVR